MVNEFKAWISDNTNLYEALEGQIGNIKKDSRALSLGKYGLIPSLVMRELCDNVDALCIDREFIEDFRYNTDQECTVKLVQTIDGKYDFIYSPLYINSIEKSDAVKHLFDVYDHLNVNGTFILTFQDAISPVVGPAKEIEVWYQSEIKHRWKVYTVQDLMETLKVIGFAFKGLEECTTDGLGRAVSIICTKVVK